MEPGFHDVRAGPAGSVDGGTSAPSVTSLNTRSRAGAASHGMVWVCSRRVVAAHMGMNVLFFRPYVATGHRRLTDGCGVRPEEFCKQGPCRFGRSATVADGIIVMEPG